ncbi:P-loop containing nucleoside triphosphate hydrolase protein [Fimicolochytrium jonesii]|uniref:P-loop containing nucleoside triphosphate hydrolase protein n=1 Tax=Fimicolochytrium jonesii TaxID=1396493 RepID=UPI0022FF0316|nr:P-loop containing nucleoside triphosphate hydrolase protein [Fimicolochytrium jonesii]KAI8820764.1 P-loop containing nucleoside triphosphate hydrolase protein [Fimicolochytrium jonesii]
MFTLELIIPQPPADASNWGKPPAGTAAPTTNPGSAGWGATPPQASGWGNPPTSPTKKPTNGTSAALPTPPTQDNGVKDLTNKVDALTTEDDLDDTPNAKKQSNLIESSEVVEVKLADLQADVNNPLYSGVSTFEDLGLHPDLLKGIYAMGFERPSKIQEKALPLLVANPPKNMIGQSQSGTGKTAAFALTMLSRINFSSNVVQAVCLAPARELARQIMDVVKLMGKYTPVTTAFAIKDSVTRGQKITAHIVVGTPGTVIELIKRRDLDPTHIRIFVMDEADNMLDQQGLGDHSIRVKNQVPKNCQIVLFSATFPPAVREFAARFAPNANMISLRQEELSVEGIKQFYMDCKNENHKVEVLCAIYGLLTIGQSIIFCRRRDVAERLGRALTDQGHVCLVLHGGFDPLERDKAIDDFRDGRCKVLITTNVIARGIDILQVNLVINYDIPLDASSQPDPETYLHRIGRTGRFGRTGVSINFVHDERSYSEMKSIENHFGREIIRVPTDNYMEVEKILKKAVKS